MNFKEIERSNLIMFYDDPRVKDLIGKPIYYAATPNQFIADSTYEPDKGYLIRVTSTGSKPFEVSYSPYERYGDNMGCIMARRPEYIPYDLFDPSVRELILGMSFYGENMCGMVSTIEFDGDEWMVNGRWTADDMVQMYKNENGVPFGVYEANEEEFV